MEDRETAAGLCVVLVRKVQFEESSDLTHQGSAPSTYMSVFYRWQCCLLVCAGSNCDTSGTERRVEHVMNKDPTAMTNRFSTALFKWTLGQQDFLLVSLAMLLFYYFCHSLDHKSQKISLTLTFAVLSATLLWVP